MNKVTIYNLAIIIAPISAIFAYRHFRNLRLVTREEEERGAKIVSIVDREDDVYISLERDLSVDQSFVDGVDKLFRPSSPSGESTAGSQPSTTSKPKRLGKHNHEKLARKLADECKMQLSLRGFTDANDLVVEQFLKNRLRQIPNLRHSHALKIIELARLMVFVPRECEIEASGIRNSRAFMERRWQMDVTKRSYPTWVGWFLGFKPLDGPAAST